jgi:thiamine transporter ThiT
VPGVAAFVLLGLAGPAVELEERTVGGAFARSFRLVRSDFWLVFWVLIPIELAGDVLGSFAEHLAHDLLGDHFFSTWLSESVTNILFSPVFAIAAVLLTTRLITALDGSGPRIRSLHDGRSEQLGAPV